MSTGVMFVTGLPFGHGHIGEGRGFADEAERLAFAAALGTATRPLTKPNTADCVDERMTIELGDGTRDPEVLQARVVPQLAGGLGLAVTKAVVGANLAIIRDAKNFTEAYTSTVDILKALGYEDGGHADCGASKRAEDSVANEVETSAALGTLPALMTVDNRTPQLLAKNWETKRRRLKDGFYGTWNSDWHEGYLASEWPQNFSILAVDHDDRVTYGHHGRGVYAIKEHGVGFAKNQFIKATGQEAFATTAAAADKLTADIIRKIGGSDEERSRLLLEFAVDPIQVLDRLVIWDFPAFADVA